MAEKHKKTNWTTIIISGMLLLFLLAIVFGWGAKDDSINTDESRQDSQNYDNVEEDFQTISLNGIGLQRTLNYPNQEIKLDLNGQDNVVNVTESTIITEIDLNGLRNTINLCLTHSPKVNENGINNRVNYLSC